MSVREMLESHKAILVAMPDCAAGEVLIWTKKPKTDKEQLTQEALAKLLKKEKRFKVLSLQLMKPGEGGMVKPKPKPDSDKG
ncbi:MAG: hypothetical protein CSA62_14285 [Planctomycetota bacterium]|nr:MAG: hypothetical protein CSA62_14285 [Planctomycetota bacterium]